jgi:hypothetical protein
MPFYHSTVEEILQGMLTTLASEVSPPAGGDQPLPLRLAPARPPPRL